MKDARAFFIVPSEFADSFSAQSSSLMLVCERDHMIARTKQVLDRRIARMHDRDMQQTTLTVSTSGPGLYEFTDQAAAFVQGTGVETGLLTVFVRHTSCSLLIQENADPDVKRDLDAFFRRLVPPTDDPSMGWVVHRIEGPDDMPAHIKAALTQTSIGIPVSGGRMMLGTWQGIYLFEHRDLPHRREVVLHFS